MYFEHFCCAETKTYLKSNIHTIACTCITVGQTLINEYIGNEGTIQCIDLCLFIISSRVQETRCVQSVQ